MQSDEELKKRLNKLLPVACVLHRINDGTLTAQNIE